MKEETQGKANTLYAKYSSYISDEDVVEFNKLLTTDNYTVIEQKVLSFVAAPRAASCERWRDGRWRP
jgi:hypothetical protein